MYARVTKYRVPLDKLDDDIRQGGTLGPRIESMPGSLGAYYLVDRLAGETMSITLWEDERAMRDSETPATGIREESTVATSSEILSIHRYQVVMQPSRLGAGVTG